MSFSRRLSDSPRSLGFSPYLSNVEFALDVIVSVWALGDLGPYDVCREPFDIMVVC